MRRKLRTVKIIVKEDKKFSEIFREFETTQEFNDLRIAVLIEMPETITKEKNVEKIVSEAQKNNSASKEAEEDFYQIVGDCAKEMAICLLKSFEN